MAGASASKRVPLRHGLKSAALLALVLPLAACAGGFDMKKAEVDPTILTSSTSAQPQSPIDAMRQSDEVTIRNAVSSADLEQLSGQPLAWANPETGSRGAISAIAETRESGRICRSFTTSRESFDGVALFKGETCMAEAGVWRMLAFAPF